MRNWLKTFVIRIMILIGSGVASFVSFTTVAAPSSNVQDQQIPAKANATEQLHLSLRLTHSLYSAVLASYFNEGDQKYNAIYLANKQYLITFMNRWSELIETNRYRSSREIFEEIRRSNTFLGRHYLVWDKLHNQGWPDFINLGDAKNTALVAVLATEDSVGSLDERIVAVLDRVAQHVLAGSDDYDVAAIVAEAFRQHENASVRRVAEQIQSHIPTQKALAFSKGLRDFLLAGTAGLRVAGNIPGVGGAVQSVKSVPAKVGTAFHSGRAFITEGSRSLLNASLQLARNPIWKRYPAMYYAAVASVAGHAGILAVSASSDKLAASQNREQEKPKPKPKYVPTAVSLGLLWSYVNVLNPAVQTSSHRDFTPQFTLQSKEQLIATIREYLKRPPENRRGLDYLTVFLQAEKLQGLDHRSPDDFLAMDLIHQRIQNAKRGALKVAKREKSEIEKIEEIRKLMIEKHLKNYSRDYPNLTANYLGWGGNCVTQTMLFAGVFLHSLDETLFPATQQVGVAWFTDHVETVLFDENEIQFSMSGQVVERADAVIYRPEYLLYLVLRNFSADQGFTPDDFVYPGGHHAGLPSHGKKSPLEQQMTREGILENVFYSSTTFKDKWSRKSVGEPAEFSVQEFKPRAPKPKSENSEAFQPGGMPSGKSGAFAGFGGFIKSIKESLTDGSDLLKRAQINTIAVGRYKVRQVRKRTPVGRELDYPFEIHEEFDPEEAFSFDRLVEVMSPSFYQEIVSELPRFTGNSRAFEAFLARSFEKHIRTKIAQGILDKAYPIQRNDHIEAILDSGREGATLRKWLLKLEWKSRVWVFEQINVSASIEYQNLMKDIAKRVETSNLQFLQEIQRRPRSFVQAFNLMDAYPQQGYVIDQVLLSTGDQQYKRERDQALVAVKGFLRNLKEVKNKPVYDACRKIAIRPAQSNIKPWAILPKNISGCSSSGEQNSNADKTDQAMYIKDENLVRLSILFGAGVHLWSPQIVDDVLAPEYSFNYRTVTPQNDFAFINLEDWLRVYVKADDFPKPRQLHHQKLLDYIERLKSTPVIPVTKPTPPSMTGDY